MAVSHRLYASVVVAGIALSGCTCSESHPPDDGSTGADDASMRVDAVVPPDAPVTDAPAGGEDACPAHCEPCDSRPECEGCLTCIL